MSLKTASFAILIILLNIVSTSAQTNGSNDPGPGVPRELARQRASSRGTPGPGSFDPLVCAEVLTMFRRIIRIAKEAVFKLIKFSNVYFLLKIFRDHR